MLFDIAAYDAYYSRRVETVNSVLEQWNKSFHAFIIVRYKFCINLCSIYHGHQTCKMVMQYSTEMSRYVMNTMQGDQWVKYWFSNFSFFNAQKSCNAHIPLHKQITITRFICILCELPSYLNSIAVTKIVLVYNYEIFTLPL